MILPRPSILFGESEFQKLLTTSITGKIFNVIYNIKSCVFANGNRSLFFPCQRGLRQGENLSPVIFSIFLNDLQSHLLSNGSNGIDIPVDEVQGWLKLLVLLYADDTVIVSNNAVDLQNTLNNFSEFCSDWKLNVNHSKSNVIVFGVRNTSRFHFSLNDKELAIIDKYKSENSLVGK